MKNVILILGLILERLAKRDGNSEPLVLEGYEETEHMFI